MAVTAADLGITEEKARALAAEVAKRWNYRSECLVEMLLDVQAEYNFLPREVIEPLADDVGVPLAKIMEVASFYNAFSLIPKGRAKFNMTVCAGTLCYVKNAPLIIDKFMQELGIQTGQVTEDGMFGLETAACLGICSLAPAMIINGEEVIGKLTQERVPRLLAELRGRAEAEALAPKEDE